MVHKNWAETYSGHEENDRKEHLQGKKHTERERERERRGAIVSSSLLLLPHGMSFFLLLHSRYAYLIDCTKGTLMLQLLEGVMQMQTWTCGFRYEHATDQFRPTLFVDGSQNQASNRGHVMHVGRDVVLNHEANEKVVCEVTKTEAQSLGLKGIFPPEKQKKKQGSDLDTRGAGKGNEKVLTSIGCVALPTSAKGADQFIRYVE